MPRKRKPRSCKACGREFRPPDPRIKTCSPECYRVFRQALWAREKEPTEEQLDRLIEEQRKCLPDWWGDDVAKGYSL